tara:strand:+ start:686 stop:1471 length:786 start_codon:yes stop_codon:yes gene_type:complete
LPDDPQRREREKTIEDSLLPVFEEYKESAIAVYQNTGKLPSRGFWETMKKRLASAVQPVIALVMSDALNIMLRPTFESLATPANNRAVSRDAKRRAEQFSVNFSDMVLTNIAETVPSADEDEDTAVFVTEMFEDIFAENKAMIIAVGLVTSAITAGEMLAAVYIQTLLVSTPPVAREILEDRPDSIGLYGIDYEGIPERPILDDIALEIIPVWVTQDDALVCPVCSPLHETTEENWGEFEGPPAHYMCRCFLRWVIRRSMT